MLHDTIDIFILYLTNFSIFSRYYTQSSNNGFFFLYLNFKLIYKRSTEIFWVKL